MMEIKGFDKYRIDEETGAVYSLTHNREIGRGREQVALRRDGETFYYSRGVLLFAAQHGLEPGAVAAQGFVIKADGGRTDVQEWGDYIRGRIRAARVRGAFVCANAYEQEGIFWQLCCRLSRGENVEARLIDLLVMQRVRVMSEINNSIYIPRGVDRQALYYDAIAELLTRLREGERLAGSMVQVMRRLIRQLLNDERTRGLPLKER